MNGNPIDPFIPFPLKEAKTSDMLHFNEFFRTQGGSVQDTNHGFVFESEFYPWFFPVAMQNPALCMSCVAMSATYTAIHGRGLVKPDAELLRIYSQCFEVLRKQIELEDSSVVSEASVVTAINLVMCSGIAFDNHRAAVAHWNGLTAMWGRFRSNLYTGPLIGFFDQLEYWLTLMMGRRFQESPWRTPIPREKPLTEVYGKGFGRLFASQIMTSSMPKLLETCLNTCRATEVLEEHLQNLPLGQDKQPGTYFYYLRAILNGQNTQVFADLSGTNTFEECISITINIFFVGILRMTAWKAPVKQLCTKLRCTIAACGLVSSISAPSSAQIDEGFSEEEESEALMKDAYVWMLFICACAAKSCCDEVSFEWCKDRLKETYIQELSADCVGWETLLPQNLRLFCWSDKFLTRNLKDVCSSIVTD